MGDKLRAGWRTVWTPQDWHQASSAVIGDAAAGQIIKWLCALLSFLCLPTLKQYLSLTQLSHNDLELKGKPKGYFEKCLR